MGVELSRRCARGLSAAVLLWVAACSNGGGAAPAPTDGFDEDSGLPPVRADAGAPKDAGAVDAGPGPVVTVISPEPTDDPDSEAVISGSTLSVRCEVKKNPKGELVDVKSVKVSIYPDGLTKAVTSQVATSTDEPDVFEAQNINLVDVPHGPIQIECAAADLGTKVERSTASITTLSDRGPKVTFLSPMAMGFVSAVEKPGEDVRVRFRVEPQPLGDDDKGAEISEIKATVGGKVIAKLDESTTEENVYSFGLDFGDTQFFTVVPDTLSVRIDAANSRTPKPRTVVATLAVGVDSEGPTITVKSPARVGGQDPVVSGKVDVILEVVDKLAGVNIGSVEIRVEKKGGGGKDNYPAAATGTANTYASSFESGVYSGLPSLSITLVARDNAGIETQTSLRVDVDTVSPWLSLDSHTVRERFRRTAIDECTGPFDPLGDAVDEGAVITAERPTDEGVAFRTRAIIWDRPLAISNNTSVRYAMIKAGTTKLYIQHNTDVPLLIDSDNDANNECDKINVNSEDVTRAPVTILLSPVKTTGTGPLAGSFSAGTFVPDLSSPPSVEGMCISTSGSPPNQISEDTTMTRVIKHSAAGSIDVVYADSPTPTGIRSTGVDYVSPRAGWACLVAVAEDNAGNFGFSPPMHICSQFGTFTCAPTMPTCTDGCIVPSQFQADAPDRMPDVIRYAL